MDRNNRDARRATTVSTSMTPPLSNGLPRRRHRTSLRDSLEEDGPKEMTDTSRSGLRDRHVGGKKDRQRIDRLDRLDRDRDRDRERLLRNKRRRGDRNNNHLLIHHSGLGNKGEELGMVSDESSEESVNDNEDEDDDDHHHHQQHTRLLQPASAVTPSALMMLNNSRRSYPPSASAMAAAGTTLKVTRPARKVADEMIGVSVPRKARSASAKRSHDCWVGGGATASHASGASGDQALQQPSTSPVRTGLPVASPVNNRPASPSSSNALARKKLKPNGPKQRPPKLVSKPVSSSATQDEIEIAEVLYGMMGRPQGQSSKSEVSFGGEFVKTEDSRDENNKPTPVSNSGSVLPPQNSSSSIPLMSAIAPKRKKPRAIKYDEEHQAQSMYPVRNSPITAKIEMDSVEKGRGSVMENGGTYEPGKPQDTPVLLVNRWEDHSNMEGLFGSNKREESLAGDAKEFPSLKKESGTAQLDGDLHSEGKIEPKRSCVHEVENHLEEKYQIDLMAPPPTRSSPGRDGDGDFAAGADQMSITSNGKATGVKDKQVGGNAGDEEVKMEPESEGRKPAGGGGDGKGMGLEIGLEGGGDGGGMMMMGNASSSFGSKGNPQPKQQQPVPDKSAQSTGPLTFPIPVACWPGSLPPLGYLPLPGVVSMDGSTVASTALQPPQLLFSQPRSKRCTTHCYIARNISYHHQMAKMPFWLAAAGSVPLYGAKPCSVNVIPSADPNGNVSTRSVNAVMEKGQNLGLLPVHKGKAEAFLTTSGLEAQRKPVLLQQDIPPGAPGNILRGPAFIFPLNQQHAAAAAAAAAASVRSGSSKSPNVSNTASTPGANAGSASASSSLAGATGAAAAMGFSYPTMPGGETQYLAILQNNSYPFPVPAHVGAAPAYSGTHPQAVPYYNGPFYSSQMLHPSQLPQQLPANLLQMQQGQGHQNASISSGLSTSLKHLPNHQPRPPGSVGNGPSGSLQQGFPSRKNQSLPQTLTLQPQINQQQPHQVRPLESEATGEDSPSAAETRIPHTNLTTIYGQNYAMPIHNPNYALMTQATLGGPNVANSNNPSEKQQPQMTPQHQGSKQSAIDSLQSQTFALSFGNMDNSAYAHALDISSIAQGHTILQNLPEATRQTYQIMAVAAAAQNAQQKNIWVSDYGKGAENDDDRKPLVGKCSATVGQSIAFSRTDPMDASVSSLPGSSVVDSSVRTLNLGAISSQGSASVMPALVSPTLGAPSPQQLQGSQQQQMIQLQKQHQFAAAAAAAARSKTPATGNASVYSEHFGASTSPAAKFPSSLSSYPQNLIPGSGSQTQPPQWRGSTRPATSPMLSSFSPATATSSSLKLLSQQPVRVSPGQTHISFANSNSKSGSASQGLQIPSSSQQSPSSPVVVGSPTTSSVSKSTGGSPRATTSSTGNKPVQAASSLQTPQAKNSSHSMPMHKSSPVGSGSVSSILGSPPLMASLAAGTKHQLPQQQHLSKQNLQQAQLFFSHPYVPVPPAHSTMKCASTVSATSAYYIPRRPSEQQPKVQQLPKGSASSSSSSAMLSLCTPVTVASSGTCDPVKAVAVSNLKGNNLQSQGIIHAAKFATTQTSGGSHQIVPTGFSYVHAVPNAVQMKPAEQKPPVGE